MSSSAGEELPEARPTLHPPDPSAGLVEPPAGRVQVLGPEGKPPRSSPPFLVVTMRRWVMRDSGGSAGCAGSFSQMAVSTSPSVKLCTGRGPKGQLHTRRRPFTGFGAPPGGALPSSSGPASSVRARPSVRPFHPGEFRWTEYSLSHRVASLLSSPRCSFVPPFPSGPNSRTRATATSSQATSERAIRMRSSRSRAG